jgi:hypothetical protein
MAFESASGATYDGWKRGWPLFCWLLTRRINSCNLLLAAERFKRRFPQPESRHPPRIQADRCLAKQLHRRTESTLRHPKQVRTDLL